jgi:hypothetical protein
MNIIKIQSELILENNTRIKDAIKSLNKTGKRICFITKKKILSEQLQMATYVLACCLD